jgi:hypothetical protein
METAVATLARFAADVAVPFPLRDVDDLHDADLDGVLADRLVDAGPAAVSASELVNLVGRSAPAAMSAHTLGAQALLLAVL